MSRLQATVSLLARYGIFSLIDMHQDVYNEAFGGEGAPNWAVCTDGITPEAQAARRRTGASTTAGPGVAQAYGHFWDNDVVGNLQGEFDTMWTKVAGRFRGNPWVVGYDPFNEPYGPGLDAQPNNPTFDAELECFYTGQAHPGLDQDGHRVTCPADDPEEGLIPRSRPPTPPTWLPTRATTAPILGCRTTSAPWTTRAWCSTSTTTASCMSPTARSRRTSAPSVVLSSSYVFTQHAQERAHDATPEQPGGPGWLLTEFGATTDTADLARITSDANANLVGWIYWQWINYDDPTGSHSSALWPPRSATASQLNVLSQTYASAVAGTPLSMTFDPDDGRIRVAVPLEPEDHRAHRDRRAGVDPLPPRLLRPSVRGSRHFAAGCHPHRHPERSNSQGRVGVRF